MQLECKCFPSASGYELTWIVELYQLSLINRQRKMYPIGHHMTEKSWHTKEFLRPQLKILHLSSKPSGQQTLL